MKIAFIDWFCDPTRPGASGMSDIVWAIAGRLAEIGDEVHVIAPYSSNVAAAQGVHIHRQATLPFSYRNIVGHILLALTAWAKLRTLPTCKIVHSAEYLTTGVFGLLGPQGHMILTTPGNIYERIHNVNHFDRSATITYKAAAKISARRCSRIVATSRAMRYWWEYTGASASQIVQIPLGVDTQIFRRAQQAKTRLGLGESPTVLFLGRLQGENGAEHLIRAMPLVLERVPEARIDIVGDGPERQKLVALSEQLGIFHKIRWHGSVTHDELPLYYSAADVFVFPRLSHITPRALFEAMACETPAVTSAIEGIREFIENGETGYAVAPQDHEAMAIAVVRLLQDHQLARQIGQKAREYAEQKLDWSVIVQRLRQEVYLPLED